VDFGVGDFVNNPFGCREPSDDDVEMDHYGIELSTLWVRNGVSPLVALSAARVNAEVQVDAPIFDTVDRARLRTDGTLYTAMLGAEYRSANDIRWLLSGSWTGLDVNRGNRAESDDYWSLRILIELRPRHFGF